MDNKTLLGKIAEALKVHEETSDVVSAHLNEALSPENCARVEREWHAQITDCLRFFATLGNVQYRFPRKKGVVFTLGKMLGVVFEDAVAGDNYEECGEDIRQLVDIFYENDWLFDVFEAFSFKLLKGKESAKMETEERVLRVSGEAGRKILKARGIKAFPPSNEFLDAWGIEIICA